MFDIKYHAWNQSRIKAIVEHFTYKYFFGKRVLDLGCGYGDLGGVLYRLGADVTAVDARQEHLKILAKKFTGIKTVKSNLDGPWPFYGQKFDFTLDLGLICHLSSFDKHLKMVCASTNNLILESAVCDSDDPNKCIQVSESKEVYDLAYGNMGCRPSPAAIEKVLTECGMSFKRMDNAKFNASGYTYDWKAKNDNSTSLEKRRIWFASRIKANDETTSTNIQPAMGFTPTLPTQHNKPQYRPTGVRSPMHTRIAERQAAKHAAFISNNHSPYVAPDPTSPAEQVKNNSKQFAIYRPETFTVASPFIDVIATIRPTTISSKLWLGKIAPFFPNIKVPKDIINMIGFNKSSDSMVDVVMCDLANLQACPRIWIEEWTGSLDDNQITTLRKCQTILTPSLLNMEEILKHTPTANVERVEKPWPLINSESIPNNYLHFEKSPEWTNILLNSWEERFGKLFIVGATTKLPPFAEFVSDCADYQKIIDMMTGARGLIDLSDNTYYQSGLLDLANSINLPVISNNKIIVNRNKDFVLVESPGASSAQMNTALTKFYEQNKEPNIEFNNLHNQNLNNCIKKLVGNNA